jgi:hypothetical protein
MQDGEQPMVWGMKDEVKLKTELFLEKGFRNPNFQDTQLIFFFNVTMIKIMM